MFGMRLAADRACWSNSRPGPVCCAGSSGKIFGRIARCFSRTHTPTADLQQKQRAEMKTARKTKASAGSRCAGSAAGDGEDQFLRGRFPCRPHRENWRKKGVSNPAIHVNVV